MTTALEKFYPLGNRRFLFLIAFRVLLVLSYQTIGVVIGWHIYQLTHDPLSLGLIGLAEVLPYFSTALFAGYAVDHYSRQMLALVAGCGVTAVGVLLTCIAYHLLPGNPLPWLYTAIVLMGFARSFVAPTFNSIFALILKREQFAKGASISSTFFQLGLVLGPALGGVLVAAFGINYGYLFAAVLAFLATLAAWQLKIVETRQVTTEMPIFQSIGESIRFVINNKVIFSAQMLDMFAVLFGGMVAMLPMFIHEVFDYGPEGLGILRAAPALGAMSVGYYLSQHPITRHAGRILLIAVAGFGACMVAFALTSYFWLAAFILLLSGVFDGTSVVLRSTILQLLTPDHMRGRVSAINGIFIGSSNELGAFESGLAAKVMGLVPSVVFGGMMTLSVVGLIGWFSPKLRQLDLNEAVQADVTKLDAIENQANQT